MPWVRLDEEFPDHPKVSAAGPLAGWLHVCGLAYCNRYLTDGFVPHGQVPKLADFEGIYVDTQPNVGGIDSPSPRMIAELLVAHGLWDEVDGGYRIHDFFDYQPSRAEVEEARRQKQEAGRKGGRARAAAKAGAKADAQAPAQATAKADAQAESKPVPVPVPDNPSSSYSVTSGGASSVEEEIKLRVKAAWENRTSQAVVAISGPVNDREAWLRKAHKTAAAEVQAERQERERAELERQRREGCRVCAGRSVYENAEGFAVICQHEEAS